MNKRSIDRNNIARIYTIVNEGIINTGVTQYSSVCLTISSSNPSTVNISNGVDSPTYHNINKRATDIYAYTNYEGQVFIKTTNPVTIKISNMEPALYSNNIGIYTHGQIGDILLAAGYIQNILDNCSNDIKINITHGCGSVDIRSIYNDQFTLMYPNVTINSKYIDKFINKRKDVIGCIPGGFRKSILFFGPPGAIDTSFPHINKKSLLQDLWIHPRWIPYNYNRINNRIGVFRYSTTGNGFKSINQEQSNKLLTKLLDQYPDHEIYIIGKDDPLEIIKSDRIIDMNNKLSITNSMNLLGSCSKLYTVDSWPATYTPRVGIDTTLLINSSYSLTTWNHFHNLPNITKLDMNKI